MDLTPRPPELPSMGADVTSRSQTSLLSATRVYVRIRPFNQRELQESREPPTSTVTVAPQKNIVTVLDPSSNYRPQLTYAFERCFDSTAAMEDNDQESVYQHVGRFVLHNVIDGYNGCIFAYGQTGSGKTYTMLGPSGLATLGAQQDGRRPFSWASTPRGARNRCTPCTTPSTLDKSVAPSETLSGTDSMIIADDNSQCMEGLIPRLARDIFQSLRLKHKNNSSHSFLVEIEYYEIYNEKVFDLLAGESTGDKSELQLRHQPTCGAYVKGLVRKKVVEEKELRKWIRRGSVGRHTASTKVNERSSRSHAIFCIYVVQLTLDENDNNSCVTSKLNLVDLAGSERTGASGVEGKLFKEATKINLSLTVLGRVIDALADLSTGKRGVFCPYRDSNLTWLLMDSLGGNSKTSMVATVSPNSAHYEETCQTLRYAARAKQIVNRAIINEDPQVRQIKALTAEVARLQRLLCERPRLEHSNDDVERLQDRLLQLEQDVSDRDFTIDELRSQLLEKNVAELKKLDDENRRLQREVKELRRTNVTVQRLQSELTAATKENEQLRAQLEVLEKEKKELATCRLIIPHGDSPLEATAGFATGSTQLHLGHITLQNIKRLGITTERCNYARLMDTVTRCALQATEQYEAMLQKNTALIDSHSWALRESLQRLESKEWAVLVATGEKLVASFERKSAKREKEIEMQERKQMELSTSSFPTKQKHEKSAVHYKDEAQQAQKELANIVCTRNRD
ncbi:putative kinesin [Trypanosoma rangeli]|uniref:Kinesin-like protein n=1 Tax=Trypanosoma rangeli TaxID=5698 RepID=A0A3R7KHX7_TRYRA|nr:putative kinesin [Trypanosoma rangeli]RNF06821.1 putative kinesin [Trypanosoma rangeli]|eukprot:RNF06821.1 putative kinesin [Trypanosoma rangeli]